MLQPVSRDAQNSTVVLNNLGGMGGPDNCGGCGGGDIGDPALVNMSFVHSSPFFQNPNHPGNDYPANNPPQGMYYQGVGYETRLSPEGETLETTAIDLCVRAPTCISV